MHWKSEESSDFIVDIVTSEYLEEFVKIRFKDMDILSENMKKSYIYIKKCFDKMSIELIKFYLHRETRGKI